MEQVLETLLNLVRARTGTVGDLERALEPFTDQLVEYARAKRDDAVLARWASSPGAVLEAVKAIDPDHPLCALRKAERLFFSHQSILGEARIVTDLRPVFDRAGEKILRFMVTHSLMLEYYEGAGPKRLQIGLDSVDLARLKSACERAEVKAVTLRDSQKDKPWPTTLGLDDPKRE